jgi:uncharacterized protein (TIGR02266 family)
MDIADIIVKLGFGAVIYILAMMLIKSISAYFRKRVRWDRGHGAAARLAETGQKKRQHPRVDITWPVRMKTSQGTIEAETENISLGGAFICCHKPLPLGENFRLTIDCPNRDPLTVNAEVVWSNINVPDEKIVNRGMGIRFIQVTEDDRKFLSEMISAHLD